MPEKTEYKGNQEMEVVASSLESRVLRDKDDAASVHYESDAF